MPNYANAALDNIKIRTKVVLQKLKHLKICKATGLDGIPARVLKECAWVLSKLLTCLFSMLLHQCIAPEENKCVEVVSVKSDGTFDPNNHRPISLLRFGGHHKW